MSVYELLERHLATGADRPLLVTPERTYSSADVARESAKVAHWLGEIGVVPGDRVTIDLKNGVAAVAALFGVARTGAIAVAASPQWMPRQLEYVLADAGSRVLVTSDLRAKQLGNRRPPHVLVDGACPGTTAWDSLVAGAPDAAIVRDREAPAILLYTSGSTGRPKGVVHPHANLLAFATVVADYLENTADDRLLWVLGWSFGYGLSQLLTICTVGGRLIVPASMLPADVASAHATHAATGLAQVPFGWDQLVGFLERTQRTLPGLRYVTNAGDGPSAALVARMQRVLPGAQIVLMYGQTECFRTTYLPPAQLADKGVAMGYPIAGVEVEVRAEDGRACAVDEPGELHHVGALVATGYWNDPEATARKFAGDNTRRVLRTGDLVRRDADGCLFYVGRWELVIKSSGFRFSPREIEQALATHPAIREVVAFGVDEPVLGQAVEVAVVTEEPIAVAALLAHLRPVLPRYMLPRRIHVLDALPRSPNGKLSLDALRALAR